MKFVLVLISGFFMSCTHNPPQDRQVSSTDADQVYELTQQAAARTLSDQEKIEKMATFYKQQLKDLPHKAEIKDVILSPKRRDGQPRSLSFGFEASHFNGETKTAQSFPDVYISKRLKAVIRPNSQELVIPLSKTHFLNQNAAFVRVLYVAFTGSTPATQKLLASSQEDLMRCMDGPNGMMTFLNNHSAFEGFEIYPGIQQDPDALNNFERSLWEQLKNYEQHSDPIPHVHPKAGLMSDIRPLCMDGHFPDVEALFEFPVK